MKKFLLFSVLTIIFSLIGYSISCYVAYLFGWPPFWTPIICGIVLIATLFIRYGVRGIQKTDNTLSIFGSLFLSCLVVFFILNILFYKETYCGPVMYVDGYTFNKWGYKYLNMPNTDVYDEDNDVIYLMSENRVYVLNLDGEFIEEATKYEEEIYKHGKCKFVKNPYTHKYHYASKYGIDRMAYEFVTYLGKDEKGNYYYQARKDNGKDDILGLSGYNGTNCIYCATFDYNGYIYAFEIQMDGEYRIVDDGYGSKITSEYYMYERSYKHFYYYDEYGERHNVSYD